MEKSYYNIAPDVILADKPVGISSHGFIQDLKRELGVKKIGHAGTLDPLASGAMIVGIDSGTKKMQQYVGLPKTYLATVLVGEERDAGDLEGKIIEEVAVGLGDIAEEDIRSVLSGFVIEHNLPVPLYSAIKVAGRPLYWYARNGKTPPHIPTKAMEVVAVQVTKPLHTDDDFPGRLLLRLEITVSSGSYIRTLVEEFGRQLGFPATLAGLRRTAIGSWQLAGAAK